MTSRPRSTAADPDRPLGRRGRAFVAAGLVGLLLLLGGLAYAGRRHQLERAKRRKTLDLLERVRRDIHSGIQEGRGLVRADGSGDDPTGLARVPAPLEEPANPTITPNPSGRDPWVHSPGPNDWLKDLEDGWGHVIRYRCPGPVHRRGYDLWSFGPDGKNDEGEGDDLLVGEDDIAPIRT